MHVSGVVHSTPGISAIKLESLGIDPVMAMRLPRLMFLCFIISFCYRIAEGVSLDLFLKHYFNLELNLLIIQALSKYL